MKDRISITMLEDGVADVRLIRADKMNALDGAMWEALAEAIDTLKAADGLRVVVLSGEGRAFCAGLDLSSLSADRDPGASSAGGFLPPLPAALPPASLGTAKMPSATYCRPVALATSATVARSKLPLRTARCPLA